MNIQEAKETIEKALRAYFARDEIGFPLVPLRQQRPILLIGPPGIGKTAIMEQIAEECGVGLVAYTMTHHTRQSAMGLPEICTREIEGKTVHTTEYTMSEIIASIYDCMEQTGKKRGILFLDEINCVSETLAPVMLQLLQDKKFGNQHIPDDWLIVAAGNPPEYNKSVREFDMVTLDRVRCMQVEADLGVWKAYARSRHIHGAILSYLELRPKNFYRVEADVDGLQFVTARGWEDLSILMQTYEEMGLPVDETVVGEFLHHKDVAEDAAAYFDLYQKYKDDYGIPLILEGKIRPEVFARIYDAAFDERLSVVNLLLDGLQNLFRSYGKEKAKTDRDFAALKEYRNSEGAKKEVFEGKKASFDIQRKTLEAIEEKTAAALEHAFDFMEHAFENGEEMVVFVTELTLSPEAAMFLAEHTCERYMTYNEQLLIGKRKRELLSELNR